MGKVTQDVKQIFVVGNSRSGTTMMGRILGNHPSIFTFKELHFFEQFWNPKNSPQVLSHVQAKQLTAKLLTMQRNGYYRQGNPRRFFKESDGILRALSSQVTPPLVFAAFLSYESNRHGKSIPCDQTPRNIYYLPEILELYPQAYIVNMIRDPRDVLLSQKYRWRRRFLGGDRSVKQSVRVWSGYHPLTISMLWNSGVRAGDVFAEHPRVFPLHFEDLLEAPEERVFALCSFIGLEFQPEMLQVPHVGSSLQPDRLHKIGIDPNIAGRWLNSGLTATEIFICQKISKKNMEKHGYTLETFRPRLFGLICQSVMWMVKSGLALLLNISRAKNIVEAITRRLKK